MEVSITPFDEIIEEGVSSLVTYTNPFVVYYDYQQIIAGYEKLEQDVLE